MGGITPDQTRIETSFLDRLLDQLYGGEKAQTSGAHVCLARRNIDVKCSGRQSCLVQTLPSLVESSDSNRARQRLFEALQAVHLRAETHITVRELRAALVYILFGVHFCEDYHADSASDALPYWDRAFSADSRLSIGIRPARLPARAGYTAAVLIGYRIRGKRRAHSVT